LEASYACRILAPASSPDLALTDFFLFGFLREKLRKIARSDEEHLIWRVQTIFNEISESILISKYQPQTARLSKSGERVRDRKTTTGN
jgi:hypothetical protein